MILTRIPTPRFFVICFFVIFAVLAVVGHACAQAPSAAPTAAPAQTQDLPPPSGVSTIDASTLGAGQDAGGFSIVNAFLRADIVVKVVMVLLLLASLWSWAIIFNKWLALSALKRKA